MTLIYVSDGAPTVTDQLDDTIALTIDLSNMNNPNAGGMGEIMHVDRPLHGFVLEPATALAVALRLIDKIAVTRRGPRPEFAIEAIEGGPTWEEENGKTYAAVRLSVAGTDLNLYLERKELTDAVATLAAILRDLG